MAFDNLAGLDRWLGIDFSGSVVQWRPGRRTSNVWVAEVVRGEERLRLVSLRRVQDLPGDEAPFDRLAALLQGSFSAAGIDAPFSVPSPFVGSHAALLNLVAKQERHAGRPFITGGELVRAVTGQPPPLSPPKPLRVTDKRWQDKGVNTRSTLWSGARGGAPMTAACLTLLHAVGGPVWPFSNGRSLLAEAFPAAQLRTWGLPHQGYGKPREGAPSRRAIVEALHVRIALGSFAETMLGCPDAMDAVVAAFGAVAVTTGKLVDEPGPTAGAEGWIAVHR